MKKLLFVFIIILSAANIYPHDEEITNAAESEAAAETPVKKEPPRMKNRAFELGIANINFGITNNLAGLGDIFNSERVLYIDYNNLKNGFNFGVDLNIRPLYFNINSKDKWGFGLDIANIKAYGNIDISGDLLNLNRTNRDDFGVGASVFADVGLPIFFHVKNVGGKELKINFRPAGFITVLYAKPDMRYTLKEVTTDGIRSLYMEVNYAARLYTPVSLDPEMDMMSTLDIGRAVGFDINLGAEYPLFRWLDIGVNFSGVPIVPSRLNYYMEVKDKMSMDTSGVNISDFFNDDTGMDNLLDEIFSFPENSEITYGSGKDKYFTRPFKFITYANYRPFKFTSPLFTLTPMVGLSINDIFVQSVSPEAGVNFRCDFSNIFITSLGIHYTDQLWKNSIEMILNLRILELGIGITMQSRDFLMSWQAAGLNVDFSLKIGF